MSGLNNLFKTNNFNQYGFTFASSDILNVVEYWECYLLICEELVVDIPFNLFFKELSTEMLGCRIFIQEVCVCYLA